MNDNFSVDELLSNIYELRFALTDALVVLERVYEYAVMPSNDVNMVKDSLLLAEETLTKTDVFNNV